MDVVEYFSNSKSLYRVFIYLILGIIIGGTHIFTQEKFNFVVSLLIDIFLILPIVLIAYKKLGLKDNLTKIAILTGVFAVFAGFMIIFFVITALS